MSLDDQDRTIRELSARGWDHIYTQPIENGWVFVTAISDDGTLCYSAHMTRDGFLYDERQVSC